MAKNSTQPAAVLAPLFVGEFILTKMTPVAPGAKSQKDFEPFVRFDLRPEQGCNLPFVVGPSVQLSITRDLPLWKPIRTKIERKLGYALYSKTQVSKKTGKRTEYLSASPAGLGGRKSSSKAKPHKVIVLTLTVFGYKFEKGNFCNLDADISDLRVRAVGVRRVPRDQF